MSKNDLAINGGTPLIKNRINYSQHQITKEDIDAVSLLLKESDWIAGRSHIVTEFEQAMASYTGYKYAVAVNSATSGLYLCFLAYNRDQFSNGMEVTVPALTFVATMNAPLLAGFNVKIVDVEPATYLLPKIYSAWSIPVSYAGYPLSQRAMFYDDAHSLSRTMSNYSSNEAAVISTHAIKPITTGEGGVVLTNDQNFADLIRLLSDHGYGQTNYGHNFRMSSIQATLGLSQLERAGEMFLWRKELAKIYRERLGKNEFVTLQQNSNSHSNHIFPVILDDSIDRDWFRKALFAEGVATQIHYEPLHRVRTKHSEFRRIKADGAYPVADRMWEHGFSLPMHNSLSIGDCRKVMDAFEKILENRN
jgi:dTDP-4-amino-4,6-dideoxygalactose transaminase